MTKLSACHLRVPVAKHICNDPLILSSAQRLAHTKATGQQGDGQGNAEAAGDEPDAVLSVAEQQALLRVLSSYNRTVAKTLHKTHAELTKLERGNQKVLLSKGELSDESLANYDRCHKLHERLVAGCAALSEALNEKAPVLQDGEEEKTAEMLVSMHAGQSEQDHDLFEDEDARAFYEQLPDLKSVLPAVLFADPKDGMDAKDAKAAADASLARVEELLASLPICGSSRGDGTSTREQVDSLASELCVHGAKYHPRKLIKAFLSPPQKRPEILPYYARLAAILSPCYRHVASEVTASLLADFEELHASPDEKSLPSRLFNVQYLGELVKFKVLSFPAVAKCLKTMLDDFKLAHVQVVCTLLDTCGRYLYRHPDTQARFSGILDLLGKLRSLHRLPMDYSTMLDNAVYTCKPPEKSAIVQETRPLLQRYIIWLLHHHLGKNTVEKVIKQLRKLRWDDPDVREWVHQALIDCASVKYHIIHLVACVISGLARYHEPEMLRLVEATVEAARAAVERNDFREAQRRVCLMRLVGELYNYQLIDSSTVFKILDLVLPKDAGLWGRVVHLAHVPAHLESAGGVPTARALLSDKEPMGDGPSDCNRLRCACALLDTCGQFFCKGAAKRKLDMFLVYLMRYLFCKALSIDMDFTLADTLHSLRPHLVRPASYADACVAVRRLQDALAEDQRKGEQLAHELLHNLSAGVLDVDNTEGDEDEEGGRSEEEDDDDEADEAMEAELEEVERQLRELEMAEEEAAEEEVAYVAPRREATREEQDDFERDMQMVRVVGSFEFQLSTIPRLLTTLASHKNGNQTH